MKKINIILKPIFKELITSYIQQPFDDLREPYRTLLTMTLIKNKMLK